MEGEEKVQQEDEDVMLEENVKKLMDRHKQYKKQQHIEKELQGNNILLQKYDTCRALALKLKSRVAEESGKSKSSRKLESETLPQNPPSPKIINNQKEENPETTVISSPKRGKIRPRSAPSNRTRKEVHSKSTNDLYHHLTARSKPHDVVDNDKVPRGFDTQQPLAANTLTHDEWWLLAQQTNTNNNRKKHLSKSQSQPQLSQQEIKEQLRKSRQNKPKRLPPSAYLAEHKEKEQRHLKEIAITVMEEAYLMESKAYGCVDEANAYAKALGLKKRFSIYTRNDSHNSKQQFLKTKSSLNDLIQAQKILTGSHQQGPGSGPGPGTGTGLHGDPTQEFYHKHITEIMKGCGNRLEKMCIEVMNTPGEPTQLISLDKFYYEHNKLQLEVRKRRNLMNIDERKVNITIENNEIYKTEKKRGQHHEGGGAGGPGGGAGAGAGGGGTGGGGGGGGGGMIDPNDVAALLLIQNNEKKNNLKQKKNKEMKKEENNKQITEEKLLKILEDTKDITKILENQLKELKLRGWNENIL